MGVGRGRRGMDFRPRSPLGRDAQRSFSEGGYLGVAACPSPLFAWMAFAWNEPGDATRLSGRAAVLTLFVMLELLMAACAIVCALLWRRDGHFDLVAEEAEAGDAA